MRLLTSKEAAAYLGGVSKAWISARVKDGTLPHVRLGAKLLRFDLGDLEWFKQAQQSGITDRIAEVFKAYAARSWDESHGFVYFARAGDSGPIKIGWSKNPRRRIADLQTGASGRLKLLAVLCADRSLEELLHVLIEDRRIAGEWFDQFAVSMILRCPSIKKLLADGSR